jgi:TRAP-type C4-dicarboxylate transport system permease small subunit
MSAADGAGSAHAANDTRLADLPGFLRPLERLLQGLNSVMVALGMMALVAASLVLTYSVVSRYLFQLSTDWQDEAAVFCLVGATFLCGAFVQSLRGHIGIEAVASVLPEWLNRWRLLAVDLISTLFCLFFSWKSILLWHEAWVEQQTTSSTWAPPLWIPYALMSIGMVLLSLQLLLQLAAYGNRLRLGHDRAAPEVYEVKI